MDQRARVDIRLLGPRLRTRLTIAGQGRPAKPLLLASRKARALFYFLAMQPRGGATRDRLATLLWGDRLDGLARQNLRQCVGWLRRQLAARGLDLLIIDGDFVGLRQNCLSVDALEFAALAHSSRYRDLERAAALYRGEFLAGNDIEAASFNEWLREQRERLQSLAARIFQEYAEQAHERGRGEQALEAAIRLTALDPLREDWQRLLLELLARHRGREAAIAQGRRLATLLRAELDIEPSVATRALLVEIEHGAIAPASHARAAGARGRAATPQPGLVRPSIAVCPFLDFGGDRRDTGFAAGLAARVVTALARVKSLCVIAPGRAGEPTAGEREGNYLLRGNISSAGARVRIDVHLVERAGGTHLWAQSFDHDAGDLLGAADVIAAQIAAAVEPRVYAAEAGRANRQPAHALDARGCVMAAFALINVRSRHEYARAGRLLSRAIELDSSCTEAYSLLAYVTALQVLYGWKSRRTSMTLATQAARTAVLCDVDHPWAHFAAGFVHAHNRETEQAIECYHRALALNPHFGLAHTYLGSAFSHLGRTDEALAQIDTAERLCRRELFFGVNNYVRANAYFAVGRPHEASVFARKSIEESPGIVTSHRQLVVNCALAGEMKQARAALDCLRRLVPDISLRSIEDALPYGRDSDKNRFLDGFRLLGIK
jgi:DNA-binding SARP family transcriptional activator